MLTGVTAHIFHPNYPSPPIGVHNMDITSSTLVCWLIL